MSEVKPNNLDVVEKILKQNKRCRFAVRCITVAWGISLLLFLMSVGTYELVVFITVAQVVSSVFLIRSWNKVSKLYELLTEWHTVFNDVERRDPKYVERWFDANPDYILSLVDAAARLNSYKI